MATRRPTARPSAPARKGPGVKSKRQKRARQKLARRKKPKHRHFTTRQIVRWMDVWHARTGKWPRPNSGRIPGTGGVTWGAVEYALAKGRSGLPAGFTLAQLRAVKRGVPRPQDRPRFTERKVLRWADAFHARTGRWPRRTSGTVADAPAENWQAVDYALRLGLRGLPGGSSLRRLLARDRGVRNERDLPPLDVRQVLRWAVAHRRRFGRWPSHRSGSIADSQSETWSGINRALRSGRRGLPGGSSLARLLAERRGARNIGSLPALSVSEILRWADAHHARTGQWPICRSGPISEAPGETWVAVENALRQGLRGLRGGSSLIQLLAKSRGIRNRARLPRLSIRRILGWADAFHQSSGRWPTKQSGLVVDAADETWARVDSALRHGLRGLPGGMSLAGLLAARRQVRHRSNPPPLSSRQVLKWADAFHARTGRWPKRLDGPIPESDGERWDGLDLALRTGARGLSGGSSLAALLATEREVRCSLHLPPLSIPQIRVWASAHLKRHGALPTRESGAIPEAPGETWQSVHNAIYKGTRGLRRGTTLGRVLRG